MTQFNYLGDQQVLFIRETLRKAHEQAVSMIEAAEIPPSDARLLQETFEMEMGMYLDRAILNTKMFHKDPNKRNAKPEFVPLPTPGSISRQMIKALKEGIDGVKAQEAVAKADRFEEEKNDSKGE